MKKSDGRNEHMNGRKHMNENKIQQNKKHMNEKHG